MEKSAQHGNIVQLEHINLNHDNAEKAVAFFLHGLGCSQDPRMGELVNEKIYLNRTFWANAGLAQFHLPLTSRGGTGALNNVLRGRIGIDVPSLSELHDRLTNLRFSPPFATDSGSAVLTRRVHDALEITSHSGNIFLARERPPSARDTRAYHPGQPSWCLGIPFVEIKCPLGTAPGIARYYQHYLGAKTFAADGVATVQAGPCQQLLFVEDAAFLIDTSVSYQEAKHGTHVCIYVSDHSGPMARLAAEGLLWGNPRYELLDRRLGLTQFRFKDIVDPCDVSRPRKVLVELEHEVRALEHETSPFGGPRKQPYFLLERPATVPALVKTVTDEYELDFETRREQHAKQLEGFVPVPGMLCKEPIVLYTWDTPNGKKVSIALEELGLPYQVKTVDIGRGEQFEPNFLRLSPNNKIPAIVDPNAIDATTGRQQTVFESGAILLYLAQTYGCGRLLGGNTPQEHVACMEWLMFQVGGFGPIPAELHRFLALAGVNDAPVTGMSVAIADAAKYGLERFDKETRRLYGVMDKRLAAVTFFSGNHFSIADIALFGWVWRHPKHKVDLVEYPSIKRWYEAILARPATQRGLAVPSPEQMSRPNSGKHAKL